MANNGCPPHHWLIDSQNVGRCKKCGAVEDFGAKLRWWEKVMGKNISLEDREPTMDYCPPKEKVGHVSE